MCNFLIAEYYEAVLAIKQQEGLLCSSLFSLSMMSPGKATGPFSILVDVLKLSVKSVGFVKTI